eukprot:gene13014-27459_t
MSPMKELHIWRRDLCIEALEDTFFLLQCAIERCLRCGSEMSLMAIGNSREQFDSSLSLLLPQLDNVDTHNMEPLQINGDIYDAEWMDGYKHGKGRYNHSRGHVNYLNGSSYDGEYKYGNKHGNGTYFESNGAVYTGHWKEGNMHGHGVLAYPNGSKYTGHWCDDKRHGHGIYYDIDGNIIQQGTWTSGVYNT